MGALMIPFQIMLRTYILQQLQFASQNPHKASQTICITRYCRFIAHYVMWQSRIHLSNLSYVFHCGSA